MKVKNIAEQPIKTDYVYSQIKFNVLTAFFSLLCYRLECPAVIFSLTMTKREKNSALLFMLAGMNLAFFLDSVPIVSNTRSKKCRHYIIIV